MANEHWYALKVRGGFEMIVAQRLRNVDLEVFVPDHKSTPEESNYEDSRPSTCVYARFDVRMRHMVTNIPGVLDILGTPDPNPLDTELSDLRAKTRRR